MKKHAINIFSALLIALLFYFLGRVFLHNWYHIREYSFHFNIPLVIVASLLYAASFFFLAVGWAAILHFLRHPLPLPEVFLYFCITQIAKYIPGKIWIALARMKYLKPRHKIPNSVTLLSTGIEAVLEVLAGTYVSAIAILQIPALGKFSLFGTIIITVIGLLLLIPHFFYFFVNLFLKIVKRPLLPRNHHASFDQLFLLQMNYVIFALCLGLAQLFFLQSFAPVANTNFAVLIGIGAFSYVASILALFSPSGIGVREGVWYIALKRIVEPHVAIIYAFASRLWTIAVEVILLLICLPTLWWLRKRRND